MVLPTEVTIRKIYPFRVAIAERDWEAAFDWLWDNLGRRASYNYNTGILDDSALWYMAKIDSFYFKDDHDAIEFKLRFA